jgi:tripartite-type tricarboxylate transporter receptor subunit TctC
MAKLSRRRFVHLAASAAVAPAAPRAARAQAYPTRPITIITPFAPGGISDVMARLMVEPMRAVLGQPVVVENSGGAGGSIGVARAARSAPDGYTLSIGTTGSHVLSGALYPHQFDLLRDLEPVAPLASEPLMIVGRKSLPAENLTEFIAWLKANPGRGLQGNAGVGAIGHVTGALLQQQTGTQFQFVPYRGGGPALQDLLAGQTDFEIEPSSNFAQQVRAGNLKGFAITAKTRSTSVPEVPTVDEAGLPGFHHSIWMALWLPKGVPNDIAKKLTGAVQAALADPKLQARVAELGQEIFPLGQQTPEALAALQQAEIWEWWPIIKAAGIKGE